MYNYENETNYTIDDMKTEFNAQSDVFNAYVTWYNTDGGDSKRQELFTNLVDDIGKEKLYDMSIEELKDYIDKHIEDYFDEG